MKELWKEEEIISNLVKTAKEGDTYLGDSGYWKFQNGRWVTQWVRIRGQRISGEDYEKSREADKMGYDLEIKRGNY